MGSTSTANQRIQNESPPQREIPLRTGQFCWFRAKASSATAAGVPRPLAVQRPPRKPALRQSAVESQRKRIKQTPSRTRWNSMRRSSGVSFFFEYVSGFPLNWVAPSVSQSVSWRAASNGCGWLLHLVRAQSSGLMQTHGLVTSSHQGRLA